MNPIYRPDIDGMRAVAVLSVIFFHMAPNFLKGGFVGVDVFFVISGYLITKIIISDLEQGTFSIRQFYERRFRRILPVLMVMLLTTLLTGYFLLTPKYFVDLAKSTISTVFFSSNIYFTFTSGYFDGTSELKPLLHTWSLGVEEQFYLIYPLLIAWLYGKFRHNYKLCILVCGFVSLIFSAFFTEAFPTASFYLIFTRAWELTLGAIVALNILPVLAKVSYRNCLSLMGLGLILSALFFIDSDSIFPGITAIPPAIGAALLIYVGQYGPNIVGNFLAIKPMVYTGLISYSLYLWHWPILVYGKILNFGSFSIIQNCLYLIIILFMSILSYHLIEKPFRSAQLMRGDYRIFRSSFYASGVLTILAALVVLTSGFSQRSIFSDPVYHSDKDETWAYLADCESRSSIKDSFCSLGFNEATASFFLWGDSHARTVAPVINEVATSLGISGEYAAKSACPPLLGVDREGRNDCALFNDRVINYISESTSLEKVILSGRWALSFSGDRYGHEIGEKVKLIDVVSGENLGNAELFERGIQRTAKRLIDLGKDVYILENIPEIGIDVPSAKLISVRTKRDINALIAPQATDYIERSHPVNSLLRNLNEISKIEVIPIKEYFCSSGKCLVEDNGSLIYRDDDHLAEAGANMLQPVIFRIWSEN